MKLTWHNYRYYPYERELGVRETTTLLPRVEIKEALYGLEVTGHFDPEMAKRLTYFSGMSDENSFTPTIQERLEAPARVGKNRQATRYSVHGLHEYKGKFNPQVVKSLLNIFEMNPSHNVFDPFCGSGTTLVEATHLGIRSFGADLNPLAVYVANAKLQALRTPVVLLSSALGRIEARFLQAKDWENRKENSVRSSYLENWFDPDILRTLEILRTAIETETGPLAPVFLVIASNLLRDYSLQDPHDLRIRRRKSPLPKTPFAKAFLDSAADVLTRIGNTQSELETGLELGQARICDATSFSPQEIPGPFDAAITSPPYAMALPYVDTYRLSLVWLDLLEASGIRELESEMIGSRDIRGELRIKALEAQNTNVAGLPQEVSEFCSMLKQAIGPEDGFRRKAVPILLYRYFVDMRDSLCAIRKAMKPGAPFGLIAGQNHTTLNGLKYRIDTPAHIANLAENTGWYVEEEMILQTYQRYGYHMKNAISAESLIILRA